MILIGEQLIVTNIYDRTMDTLYTALGSSHCVQRPVISTFYRSDFTILGCWLFLVGDFQVVVGIFRSDIEEVDGSEGQQGADNQECDG